jgi:hypothetical protein
LSEFNREIDFPAALLGPVLLAAFLLFASTRADELPAFVLPVAFGFNSARVALDLDFVFALFLPFALEWLEVDMAVVPLGFDS